MGKVPNRAGVGSPWEQTRLWIENPVAFWEVCHRRHGDTFSIELGSRGNTFLFANPESVRQVFALPASAYLCGPFNEHYQVIMGETSLLALDGVLHREQRRLIVPHLATRSAAQGQIIGNTICELCRQLPLNTPIDLRPVIHQCVFLAMLDVVFGDEQAETRQLLQNIFLKDLTKDYGTWSPWARFAKWHALLRTQLGRNIRACRDKMESGDFAVVPPSLLRALASFRDDEGRHLPDSLIQDQIFTMLIAGVDPSTLATLWAMYRIHSSPDVRHRLREERRGSNCGIAPERTTANDEVTAKNSVGQSEKPACRTLLEAACFESLRMIPVVTTPSGRKLQESASIDGIDYPAGVTLLPCTYLVHRHATNWPEPDKFNPDRFLVRSFRPWEYLPFGGGHRVCPGAKLALMTIQTILETCIQFGEWELLDTGPVVATRHGTLLAPSPNLRFGLKAWRA